MIPNGGNPLERGTHAKNRSRKIRRAIGLVGSGNNEKKINEFQI